MIKIPEKLFVTLQERGDSGLLGFASPYGKDEAFKKRMNTQLNWAYNFYGRDGYSYKHSYNEETNTVTLKGQKTTFVDSHAVFENAPDLIPENTQPKIIDNVPTDGFFIDESIKRCGWNGGNVVWRVFDPRGFYLEIQSGNLAKIMEFAVIDKGVIKGKCIWGRDGASNILLPDGSPEYDSAVKITELSNSKVSLKDVSLGDTVILNDGTEAIYFGKFNVLTNSHTLSEKAIFDRRFNEHHVNERYLFEIKGLKGNNVLKYRAVASPKISKIINKSEVVLLKNEIAEKINNDLNSLNFDIDDNGLRIVFVSPTRINVNELRYKTRQLTPDEMSKIIDTEYRSENRPIPLKYDINIPIYGYVKTGKSESLEMLRLDRAYLTFNPDGYITSQIGSGEKYYSCLDSNNDRIILPKSAFADIKNLYTITIKYAGKEYVRQ